MPENIKETQNKIERYYDEYTDRQKRIGVNKRHHSILEKSINAGLQADHKVLEIGCGIGTFTGLLSKYINKGNVLAVDLSPKSIEIAKERLAKFNNTEFIACDVTETEFNNQYDVIVLPDVIEHIPIEKHSALFVKLNKILKPNGFIFIHIPFPFYLDWTHENRPDLLQIIDQPLHLPQLSHDIHKAGFFVEKMESYAVFTKPYDYQYLVCKKAISVQKFTNIITKTSLLQKIKYKLKHCGKNK